MLRYYFISTTDKLKKKTFNAHMPLGCATVYYADNNPTFSNLRIICQFDSCLIFNDAISN